MHALVVVGVVSGRRLKRFSWSGALTRRAVTVTKLRGHERTRPVQAHNPNATVTVTTGRCTASGHCTVPPLHKILTTETV